jgi:hypothetical protein
LALASASFSAVTALIVVLVALHMIAGAARSPAAEHVDTYRWMLLMVVAVGRTVWDYSWCWNFYYPQDGGKQRLAANAG